MAKRTPLYKYQLIMPYGIYNSEFNARHERSEVVDDDPEIREAMAVGMQVHGQDMPKQHCAWAAPQSLKGKKDLFCSWNSRLDAYVILIHSEEMHQFVKDWFERTGIAEYGCALVKAKI